MMDCDAYGPQNAAKVRAALEAATALPAATKPAEAAPKPERLKLTPPPAEAEEDVQRQSIAALERAGFIVLQTSVRYHAQRCGGCGAWSRPQGGTGCSYGVPDLLVTHEAWPIGVWLGVELKNADGRLQPEQELLLALRRVVVSRSAAYSVELARTVGAVLAEAFEPPPLDALAVNAARAKVEKARTRRAEKAAERKRVSK